MISLPSTPDDSFDLIASEAIDPEQPAKADTPFPVVEIAALARGLEAFDELKN